MRSPAATGKPELSRRHAHEAPRVARLQPVTWPNWIAAKKGARKWSASSALEPPAVSGAASNRGHLRLRPRGAPAAREGVWAARRKSPSHAKRRPQTEAARTPAGRVGGRPAPSGAPINKVTWPIICRRAPAALPAASERARRLRASLEVAGELGSCGRARA